jgi:peptidoglycan hydrolase CwlO-like protein
MMQKTLMLVIFLLHCYHNDAFNARSFSYNKKNGLLLQLNNDENNSDLEIDTISKSINKISRLGRSKDQDGKSNIWSVEPKMEVIQEEITEFNKNILTGGLIVTGFIATLPILFTLSKYVQDIDY